MARAAIGEIVIEIELGISMNNARTVIGSELVLRTPK